MPIRKSQAALAAPVIPNGIKIAAIDIGYGAVKALAPGLDEPIIFPSVWSHEISLTAYEDDTLARYPGDLITDPDGTRYFVGYLANSQAPAGQILRLRGRTANEAEIGNAARVRLAKVALGKLFGSQVRSGEIAHIRLATGLPVDHMRGAADLKAALLGEQLIQTNDANFIANIIDVIVMPQPYGTIYANTLMGNGSLNPCHTATRTGVIDVGTYSVDFTLDDDGEYIAAESGSVETGIYVAQQIIARRINEEYGQVPKQEMIETVLRNKCLKASGKSYDFSDEVEEAYEPVRSATITKMSELWRVGLDVHTIYLSGGGATIVQQAVKNAGFSQAVLVDQPQTANARGYLYYAIHKTLKG